MTDDDDVGRATLNALLGFSADTNRNKRGVAPKVDFIITFHWFHCGVCPFPAPLTSPTKLAKGGWSRRCPVWDEAVHADDGA